MFQMFGKHSTVRPYQLGLFVGGGDGTISPALRFFPGQKGRCCKTHPKGEGTQLQQSLTP